MKSNLHDALKPFAVRAGQIRLFDLFLLDVLPHNLQGRLRVLNIRDGVLVIGVDHAALATQTRFQAPQWLDRLNQAAQNEGGLPVLTRVDIRVASEERPLKPAQKTHRELGERARASLRALAAHEPDASLASTLRRLAELGTKQTSGEG